MGELSTAEVQAGISRSALARLSPDLGNRNGHRRRPHVPDAPHPDTTPNPATQEPTPELTHVLLFHNRQLDLINKTGWQFELRSTYWQLGSSQVTYIHLNRPELEKLHSVIERVLEQAGPARPEE